MGCYIKILNKKGRSDGLCRVFETVMNDLLQEEVTKYLVTPATKAYVAAQIYAQAFLWTN